MGFALITHKICALRVSQSRYGSAYWARAEPRAPIGLCALCKGRNKPCFVGWAITRGGCLLLGQLITAHRHNNGNFAYLYSSCKFWALSLLISSSRSENWPTTPPAALTNTYLLTNQSGKKQWFRVQHFWKLGGGVYTIYPLLRTYWARCCKQAIWRCSEIDQY